MSSFGYAFFATEIGSCAIAWRADESPHAVVLVQLPGPDIGASRARVLRRLPDAREMPPPVSIQDAIDRIVALLRGEQADLAPILLDMGDVPEFHRKVFEVTRAIPPGRTRSYGDIAAEIGEPGSAQAVGQALGANPFAPVVPCHRVLAADGSMNGFSAHGGIATKRRMLEIEGALAHQFSLFDRAG